MTITTQQAQTLHGGKVYASDGGKVGSIGQVYLDDSTGEPSWVTAKTGLFGTSESFVPLEGARLDDDGNITVGYDEDKIKNAPRVDPDGHLEPEQEDELFRYYQVGGQAGVDRTDVDASYAGNVAAGSDRSVRTADNDAPIDANDRSEVGDNRRDVSDETVGHDRSGPTTDDAMTRSEERLRVGTATREAGRARLRKFVTTENVTETVPVRHEEVTLEREPITDANRDAAQSGPAISEEEHEVVLHEEVPVVEKDVVAVERVKVGKETVTEQETVSETVRKEQVEVDGPGKNDKV